MMKTYMKKLQLAKLYHGNQFIFVNFHIDLINKSHYKILIFQICFWKLCTRNAYVQVLVKTGYGTCFREFKEQNA